MFYTSIKSRAGIRWIVLPTAVSRKKKKKKKKKRNDIFGNICKNFMPKLEFKEIIFFFMDFIDVYSGISLSKLTFI